MLAPAYCLGSAESPTADFLLDLLKNSRSDPCRCVASRSCRPQVRSLPRLLCFYGRSLSRTVPAACTGPTCQNICGSQIIGARAYFHQFLWKLQNLSRLLSVLSLSQKFVHNHHCCPKSAIILTTSKLEAILDFWRGCQNLSIIQLGGEKGGGSPSAL